VVNEALFGDLHHVEVDLAVVGLLGVDRKGLRREVEAPVLLEDQEAAGDLGCADEAVDELDELVVLLGALDRLQEALGPVGLGLPGVGLVEPPVGADDGSAAHRLVDVS
jgi:hypothetical protein